MKKLISLGVIALISLVGFVGCGSTKDGSDFKVGMALTGSKTDGGWNQTAYNGLLKIEES